MRFAVLLEALGLALIAVVAYLAWWPLTLLLAGLLLLWLPNRPRGR